MRQLTSLDTLFLAAESKSVMTHVSSVVILDPSTAPGGRLTVEDMRANIAERIHLVPPFRWKLAPTPFGLAHDYWIEDPDLDLDYHVREIALAPPGNMRQLEQQVARIFARRLDRSRPLWEMYLISGLENGRLALLSKLHHAVIDGVSGAEILSVLMDLGPERKEIPPPDEAWSAERRPGYIEMLGRGLVGAPRNNLRRLRALPRLLPVADQVPGLNTIPGVKTFSRAAGRVMRAPQARMLDGSTQTSGPRTSFNGPISPHRRVALTSVPLADVKAVKSAFGVTVNDVVIALCAGAVRRWLSAHGELPADPLVAQVPVSVRTPEEMGTYGNRVSVMVVPIPTDEADPSTRIERSNDTMRAAKERHKATPAGLMVDATQFIPPALFGQAARAIGALSSVPRVKPLMNLVISNVPGPQVPLYCAGAKVETLFPVSVIMDGIGLNMTVISYCGSMDFGLVADRDQMPDLDLLAGWLHEELDELSAVASATQRRA